MRPTSVLLLLLFGCANDVGSVDAELGGDSLASIVRGRQLFNNSPPGTNGRACSSCHTTVERAYDIGYRSAIADGQGPGLATIRGLLFVDEHGTFDLSEEFAQEVFDLDPTDPLFRALDANGGSGSNFSILRDHGLIRIPFILPPNVTVDEVGIDPDVTLLPDGRTRVVVLRSSPHVLNVALKEPGFDAAHGYSRGGGLMWDGRAPSLAVQAGNALNDHFQPTIQFTAQQRADLAAFQRTLFSSPEMRTTAQGGAEPGPPPCPTGASAACFRGREALIPQPMAVDGRGFCAACHSGPMMDRTSPFNLLQPPLPPLTDGTCPCSNGAPPGPGGCAPYVGTEGPVASPFGPVCVHRISAVAQPERDFLPMRTYRTQTPFGEFVVRAHDAGRVMLTGDPCGEVPASCAPGLNVPQFMIGSLRGVTRRNRFLHDNTQNSIHDQVLDVRDRTLPIADALEALGFPPEIVAVFRVSDQMVEDITAYIIEAQP